MEPSLQAPAPGPSLLRLLARIGNADSPPASPSLAAHLGHWLEWRQAVALSAALDARPAAPVRDDRPAVSGDGGEYARVRAALVKAITSDRAFAAPGPTAASSSRNDQPAQDTPPDYAFFRQRYVALQQVMEAEVGHLRGRLRGMLARQSVHLEPLAAMDAVMERSLGPHERTLLAALPALLGSHHERLRPPPPVATAAEADATVQPSAVAWLDTFRKDMRELLLAELDTRLQPAQGLVAALHATPTGSHAP